MIPFKCPLGAGTTSTAGAGVSEDLGSKDLGRNPSICLQDGPSLPAALESSVLFDGTFSSELPVLWVRDPRTCFWMPFWIEPELRTALLDPKPGEAALDLLIRARVWIDGASAECLHRGEPAPEGQAYVRHAREQMASCGYAILRDVVHPIQSAALKSYYRELEQAGRFKPEPDRSWNRLVLSSEPAACFLQQQFETLLNQILTRKVKASYCFLMAYKPGGVLPRHTDRQQCAWNVSLALDAEPEPDRDTAWPLVLETASGPRPVRLAAGDAVIYSGTTMPHWRDPLPQRHTATFCAFHFVAEDFRGDLN